MNVNTKINKKIESDNDIKSNVITPEEANVLLNVNMPFSELMGQLNCDETTGTSSDLLQGIPDFIFDSVSMNQEDAMFFVNLTREGQFSVNNMPDGKFNSLIQMEVSQNTVSQKSVEVTNQLTTLIEKAQSTQKPVRISFDNDVSVILKIDKHGKVSAEFIPGNVEVENYLRNNIASLRQKFDEQNLPYNDLFYRQNGKQNKNRNKEKGE